MSTRSTFSQIIWLQVLAIAATSLVMPVGVFLFLDHTVQTYQVRMLRRHEQALLHALAPKPDGGLTLPADVQAPYAAGVNGLAFVVLDAAGRPLLGSGRMPQPLAPTPAKRTIGTFKGKIDTQTYVGASFPEDIRGQRMWIQVGQNLENPDVVIDDVLARFLPEVGGLSAFLLLLLLAADIVIVRRALEPILRASELADAISPSRTNLRLPTAAMPQEIRPLIDAVNQAFDRLEQGFRAQRDLTADVAHELRTPLAVLRMRIDALDDAAPKARLMDDIDLVSRTVSQLLAIAELENLIIDPADRADLRYVCLEVVQHLAPLAVGEGKRIELLGARQPVRVCGQHDYLFQAVRNLVENAIAHAPRGSRVTVEVNEDGSVRVLDRGPGVPEPARALLFQRFWRERRERSVGGRGAGLGLSIVSRIAQSHGGSIAVEDRPGGGAVFVLTLRHAEPGRG